MAVWRRFFATWDDGSVNEDLVCSAKDCTEPATIALRWNNPKIHTSDRRKTWLACAAHTDYLTRFLDKRGFLKETVPVSELPDDDGSY